MGVDWSHQDRAIIQSREVISSGVRRFVLMAPTGAGKTHCIAKIVKMAIAKGRRVMVVVNRDLLINQTLETFSEYSIWPAVIQQQHPLTDYINPIQIASVMSLPNRLEHLMGCDLIVNDECHMMYEMHKTLQEIYPNAVHIGVTATPFSKGLGNFYDNMVVVAGYRELTDKGVLIPFSWHEPAVEMSDKELRGGADYTERTQGKVYTQVATEIIPYWMQHASTLKTLVFVPRIADADKLTEDFKSQGIRAYSYHSIDAQTTWKRKQDDQALIDFKEGRLRVLISVARCTTGFDERSIECLIIARITKSLSLHIQMVGRLLRTHPNVKKGLILDMVGNISRNGTPYDIDDREPYLDDGSNGNKSDRAEKKDKPIECSCGVMLPAKSRFCPECGEEIKPESRLLAGDFGMREGGEGGKKTAIPDELERRQFYLGAKGQSEIKGYKPGWAAWLYKEKYKEWPPREWQDMPSTMPTMAVYKYIKYLAIRRSKGRKHAAG